MLRQGQFFDDLVEFVTAVAAAGLTVIIAALDGTFERKPFGRVLELIPLADSVIKLTAVCMVCRNRDAPFTSRLSDETTTLVIGGRDKYAATCRTCYESLDRAKRRP
jgi:thymidine kinase